MPRTIALCGLALAAANEVCAEFPAYRVEARTSDGRRVVLQLCSNHIHRAWQLTQALMDKKFPNESAKVRSIHLHQLSRSSAAEVAS